MVRRFIARLPERIVTGAYIINSGWGKWNGDEATAQALHGMAVGAYPVLDKLAPTTFLKALAAGEILVGFALLNPLIPQRLAGLALTGFGAGLVGLYLRTPGMHKDGSPFPTPDGIAIAKDFWLLGIGTSLVIDPRH